MISDREEPPGGKSDALSAVGIQMPGEGSVGHNGSVTDTQLYFAIGIPAAFFALNFIGVLGAAFWQSKRFEDMRDTFRAELSSLRSELNGEIKTLRAELSGEMTTLRGEIKTVRGELSGEMNTLRGEIKTVRGELVGEIKASRAELGGKIDNVGVRVKALEDELHSPLVKR